MLKRFIFCSLLKSPESEKSEEETKSPKSAEFGNARTKDPDSSARKWKLVRPQRHTFRKQLPINRNIIRGSQGSTDSLINFNFIGFNLRCYTCAHYPLWSRYRCCLNIKLEVTTTFTSTVQFGNYYDQYRIQDQKRKCRWGLDITPVREAKQEIVNQIA